MKKFLILSLVASLLIPFEACQKNKHACGSKAQKKARHKRIKRGTTFMTN